MVEVDLGAVLAHDALAWTQLEVTDLEPSGRRRSAAALRAPQQRADAGGELVGHEGLGDVVVGAGFETRHDVVAVDLRGDDQDRHPTRAPQRRTTSKPVHARQLEVDEDDVG